MRIRVLCLPLLALTAALSLGVRCSLLEAAEAGPGIPVDGLEAPVEVIVDDLGIPHIHAETDRDAYRVQGYLHARDRFWQMDLTRRQVDGSLGEVLGESALGDDVQGRVFGLGRAAARTEATLTAEERSVLQAYADGVNVWLERARAGLEVVPPEYAALEISADALRPWAVVDILGLGKGLAANLSLDIDAGLEEDLAEACAAGEAATPPFDGAKLLFQDVRRAAPIDPASTIPDATGTRPYREGPAMPIECRDVAPLVAQVKRFRARAAEGRVFAAAMQRRNFFLGSNEWGVAAREANPRAPIIANDPHLSLDWPTIFYENRIVVADDPVDGPMNVSGVSFPGAPAVILGQNERVTWGATTNPMDVSDLFRDRMVKNDPACPSPVNLCVRSGTELWPVKLEPTTYRLNVPDDGILDNSVQAPLAITDPGALIITVDHPMRSFGPVVDVEDFGIFLGAGVDETNVLVLQFTGFHPTREIDAFRKWNRAANLDDFRLGLASFDFGSQNWAYADVDGNLAYFSSAELPLRKDLEAGYVAGLPPFFVRDGLSGENNWIPDPARSQGQSIPFAVLPTEEMPQVVNPPEGFFVNANNDPAGTTLDNDPLNQRRLGNPDAIYYLSPGYASGLRAGRITRLVRDGIAGGRRVDRDDMRRFQMNVQQLDAELMMPFLEEAWRNARRGDAPPALAGIAADSRVQEAMQRLAAWDFSTPTGVEEGWDFGAGPGDMSPDATLQKRKPRKLKKSKTQKLKKKSKKKSKKKAKKKGKKPGLSEAERSVAATIYNVWRGRVLRAVIDGRLVALDAPTVGSGDSLRALFALLRETPFDGIGASGVDFFPEPADLGARDRRDLALLSGLVAALDALASDEFATAFAGSTNQDDYRWGRLHRITFDHELGGDRSVPPTGGFSDLAPGLPGLARDGGYSVVNASSFSAWAGSGRVGSGPRDRSNEFRFGGGPVRRYVGAAGPGRMRGRNAIPGGASGIPGDPTTVSQLRDWLVGDTHDVPMRTREISREQRRETFVPRP